MLYTHPIFRNLRFAKWRKAWPSGVFLVDETKLGPNPWNSPQLYRIWSNSDHHRTRHFVYADTWNFLPLRLFFAKGGQPLNHSSLRLWCVFFKQRVRITAGFPRMWIKSLKWPVTSGIYIQPSSINTAPESYLPNRKVVFRPPFFRGYVKLRGCTFFSLLENPSHQTENPGKKCWFLGHVFLLDHTKSPQKNWSFKQNAPWRKHGRRSCQRSQLRPPLPNHFVAQWQNKSACVKNGTQSSNWCVDSDSAYDIYVYMYIIYVIRCTTIHSIK